MLKHITYTFPNNTPDSRSFFNRLTELLAELPNAHMQDESLIVTPLQPVGALPATIFAQSDIPFPQLNLGTRQELSLSLGNFRINPDIAVGYEVDHKKFDRVSSRQDRLSIDELVKRLKGHIVRIDHTGVNMPSALISKESWKQFIHNVAQQANLYKYPTTDVWPFVLPATQAEHETDITQFPAGREPKLELVYDTYSSIPTIQIDVESDLTRPEVERLFPEPYGISFPELADFFRTVYVHHEWSGLDVRFDIRFKSDQPGDWETGKWLVADGGRIDLLV